jgi:hypothetical protein
MQSQLEVQLKRLAALEQDLREKEKELKSLQSTGKFN